jgi:hypothetical protein
MTTKVSPAARGAARAQLAAMTTVKEKFRDARKAAAIRHFAGALFALLPRI